MSVTHEPCNGPHRYCVTNSNLLVSPLDAQAYPQEELQHLHMYKVLKRVRSNELGAMLHEISTGDSAEWKQWQGVIAMSKVSKMGKH